MGAAGTRWYTFIGDGNAWTAETNLPSDGIGYDTKIWVFEGQCNTFSCIAGDDNSGIDSFSLVNFNTISGTRYYVVVGGDSGKEGDYELVISNSEGCLGWGCENSVPTSCGRVEVGSTFSKLPQNFGTCETSNSPAGTSWYSVVGDGAVWTAYLDSVGTNFDTKLWVFRGDCDSLVCVTGDDDSGSGSLSFVSFIAEVAVKYYIVVGGFGLQEGNYSLHLDNDIFCTLGTECSNAQQTYCGNTEIGSTIGVSKITNPLCGVSQDTAGAYWYKVVGDGAIWTGFYGSSSYKL